MIKRILFSILLFTFIACNNQTVNNPDNTIDSSIVYNQKEKKSTEIKSDSNRYNGVLLIYSDRLQWDTQSLKIYNQDNSVFTTITSKNENEPSSEDLNGKILAYYPDYYVIHFNAEKIGDGAYKVKVGSGSKIIKTTKYVEFLSLPDYVLKFFVTTNTANPLRSSASETSSEIKSLDYKQLSFKCIEIVGDWVKVKCNVECEGCPDENTNITGWLRWRKGENIIIEQHYVC